jgi:hypothetical protein
VDVLRTSLQRVVPAAWHHEVGAAFLVVAVVEEASVVPHTNLMKAVLVELVALAAPHTNLRAVLVEPMALGAPRMDLVAGLVEPAALAEPRRKPQAAAFLADGVEAAEVHSYLAFLEEAFHRAEQAQDRDQQDHQGSSQTP